MKRITCVEIIIHFDCITIVLYCRRRINVAELSDIAEHPQRIQSRTEGFLRGQRRIPSAQLSHERRFSRVGGLRRVQTSAVFSEKNEKRSRRRFQKRLEGMKNCTFLQNNTSYARTVYTLAIEMSEFQFQEFENSLFFFLYIKSVEL